LMAAQSAESRVAVLVEGGADEARVLAAIDEANKLEDAYALAAEAWHASLNLRDAPCGRRSVRRRQGVGV
jgi:NaMN:DMB phosphoribosyltransferase